MHNPATPEDAQFLAAVAAESIGWLPLGQGAYLHLGRPAALLSDTPGASAASAAPDALVIDVVGVPDAAMAGMNVLLLG